MGCHEMGERKNDGLRWRSYRESGCKGRKPVKKAEVGCGTWAELSREMGRCELLEKKGEGRCGCWAG